jgi:Tol biopolymer transport system component
MRFEIPTPEGVTAIDAHRVSPDGRYLTFNATDAAGKTRLWVRPLNALAAQPLPGTEGTGRPFWSPDSRFIGFFAEGRLKKVEVTGGPPQKICDAPNGADGSWSPEGVILYDGRTTDPIMRVPAAGGVAVAAVKPDAARKESGVGWPEFLPDGRRFLYMAMGQKSEDSTYRLGSLDSTESKAIAPAQSLVTYAPPGHLLFVRDNTLVAQPFDAKGGKITGEPIPLAEQVGATGVGLARFSTSRNGVLAYRAGETGSRLLWADRTGRELGTIGDPAEYYDTMLSPKGDRLALVMVDSRSAQSNVWIRDLSRGTTSRFTFGAGNDSNAVWSPDGKTIVFSSNRGGEVDLFQKAASGVGPETELFKSDEEKYAHAWSRDGRYIAFQSRGKKTRWDVWVLPTFGDRKPIPLVQGPFAEARPSFSPDGRWLVYESDESGRYEIYVQAFPDSGGKWQISTSGGREPQWRADGKELFYLAPDQKITSVEVRAGETLEAGAPQPLFPARVQDIAARNHYLATADGQRFLLLAPLGREAMAPTTLVLNWNAGLAR